MPEISNEEVLQALKAIERWEDPLLMAIMLPYYSLAEFKEIDHREGSGAKLSGVLRLLGLIEPREDRRFGISLRGKEFVKWAIEKKVLTPMHGAEFIVRHGDKFGRRIMFDCVFVPDRMQQGCAGL